MELMTLLNEFDIEKDIILLEPQKDFNNAIIGVSEDKCHLIYSYDKLVESMTKICGSREIAVDWVKYNTIRSLSYMNTEFKPIIIYEFENGDCVK